MQPKKDHFRGPFFAFLCSASQSDQGYFIQGETPIDLSTRADPLRKRRVRVLLLL